MFEIERKFLTKSSLEDILDYFREKQYSVDESIISQLYFQDTGEWSMRLRKQTRSTINDNVYSEYVLTIKKPISGMKSIEIESAVDRDVYENMVLLERKNLIVKKRHEICTIFDATEWEEAIGAPLWFIDIFENPLLGNLILIEVELPSEDYELQLPPFIDREVTNDPQYRNASLFDKINDAPV